MIARMNATLMAVVRAKLPSRFLDADGNFMQRGEAYGKVELDDLRKAEQRHIKMNALKVKWLEGGCPDSQKAQMALLLLFSETLPCQIT